jgi:hypothetical protein
MRPLVVSFYRVILAGTVGGFLVFGARAQAGPSLRAGAMAFPKGGSSSASATSQTATAATDANAQNVQTNTLAQHAQASLNHSIQALQAAQAATRSAAINGANNLGLDPGNPGQTLPNVPDGLAVGGIDPVGGVAPSSTTVDK